MFTGIIEEIGYIGNIIRGQTSIRLLIKCEKVLEDAKVGDSIAVNGICLTVSAQDKGSFWADVMPETMRRTALHEIKVSDPVNLERALMAAGRFGGHIVSGHIDGTGILTERTAEENAIWLTIQAPEEILKYIVMKGSVALDGASLTVADVNKDSFKVSLIPHTAGATVLGLKKTGGFVNIECDAIAKYVEKLLGFTGTGTKNNKKMSVDFLKENGFA